MINNFFWLLFKNTTWRICGFNKSVPFATQLDQIWLFWPQRSCELTPLDFFVGTIEHLKINIRQVMADIQPNMYQKVIENYLKNINACNISRGGHLNDLLFNTFIIMSTFKLYNKKRNIMSTSILYVFYLRLRWKPWNGWTLMSKKEFLLMTEITVV